MNKELYQIGDLANLIGMSRDTIRYYEKRGLLSSKKGENGYRYYNRNDIRRLISIMYQRRMNISIEDMATLHTTHNTMDSLGPIVQERLEEELAAIRQHQQTIARLQLIQQEQEHFQKQKGTISLHTLPACHVIVPEVDFYESTNLWFNLAKEYAGMDMLYFIDEYTYESHQDSVALEYKNTQLILYPELADYVDYPLEHPHTSFSPTQNALFLYDTSPERTPTHHQISNMLDWAKHQHIICSNRIFCTYSLFGNYEGSSSYYQKIYIPVID